MNQYDQIANWYDSLQSSIDHKHWAEFISVIDLRHGRGAKHGDGDQGRPLLLDLGCGTGRFSLEMEKCGYDIIGIDHSAAMLQQAREAAAGYNSSALFIQQDICGFELFGTVDLAVCLLDTVNHITRRDSLRRLFRLNANYLNQNSVLIIDIGTKKHFEKTLGNNVFYQDMPAAEERPAFTMLWQNQWYGNRKTSVSDITVFTETDSGLYERYDDTVIEKYYDWRELRDIAQTEGLKLVARYGELKDRCPNAADERMFLVFLQPEPKRKYKEENK